MSIVHYSALRSAWNRVNAQKIVNEIILNCSSFKIGKTGDTLDDRLNNYNGEYNHIDSVFLGGELEVDDMESYLIDKYINHPKCDNKKEGLASYNDTMVNDNNEYQVYVAWK